jgi:hypothetical protein
LKNRALDLSNPLCAVGRFVDFGKIGRLGKTCDYGLEIFSGI